MVTSRLVNFALPLGRRSLVALLALVLCVVATRAETEIAPKYGLRGLNEEPAQKEKLPVRTPRIINGRDVMDFRYPYFSLMYGTGICGGVLIGPRLLLTAAHCNGFGQIFRVGAYESTIDGDFVQVRNTLVHPDWNRFRLDNDIMIIQLTEATDNTYITLEKEEIYSGYFTVLGFGDTDKGSGISLSKQLQEVEMYYVDNKKCDKAHGKNGEVTEDMMCVTDTDKDSCLGDSGGPLIKKGNRAEDDRLVGLVSWGRECARNGVPGVYVRISYFYDWIVKTVCDDFPEDAPPYMGCKTKAPTNKPTKTPTIKPTRVPASLAEYFNFPTNAFDETEANATGVNVNVTCGNATGVNVPCANTTDVNVTLATPLSGPAPTKMPIKAPTKKPTKAPTKAPTGPLKATYATHEFVEIGECEGHCYTSSQCRGSLICYQSRSSSWDPVPGCPGGYKFGIDIDFCVNPANL